MNAVAVLYAVLCDTDYSGAMWMYWVNLAQYETAVEHEAVCDMLRERLADWDEYTKCKERPKKHKGPRTPREATLPKHASCSLDAEVRTKGGTRRVWSRWSKTQSWKDHRKTQYHVA